MKVTARVAKNRINSWLKKQGQEPISGKISSVEFAEQLDRKMMPRYAWKTYSRKREANARLIEIAAALGLRDGADQGD